MRELRIIFFGDSVCVGQYVGLHRGWVPRISADLSQMGEQLGRRVVVANSSANGRTTRQALEAMPYEVQSHNPDVLLIQFGLNDCNYWQTDRGVPRVSRQAFTANLEEIVERGTRAGAKAVFLHTNHPTTRDQVPLVEGGSTFEESNRSYNNAIREAAAHLGQKTHLCDFERVFDEATAASKDKLQTFLLEDGLHLSEAGHDLYFQHYHVLLRGVVRKLIEDAVC